MWCARLLLSSGGSETLCVKESKKAPKSRLNAVLLANGFPKECGHEIADSIPMQHEKEGESVW